MALRDWDSSVNGLWNVAENWSDDLLPDTEDDVVIDVEGDIEVTHQTGDTVISSVISEEAITIAGGNFTVQGTTDINALLNLQRGTVTFNGLSTAQNLVLSGGRLFSNGGLIVENGGTWSDGDIWGSAGLTNQGTFEINGSDKTLLTTLTNAGTIRHQSSDLILANETLNNLAAGTYELQSDRLLTGFRATGIFNNSGTLTKTTDATATINLTEFNQTGGTIEVQAGVLELAGNQTVLDESRLEVEDGAALEISSSNTTLRNTVSGTGAGTVSFNSVNIAPDGQATLDFQVGGVEWLRGTITDAGELINTGKLSIRGDGNKTIRGTLTNQGEILHQDGEIVLGNGTLDNAANRTYELQSGRLVTGFRSTGIFNNSGVLTKTTGDTAAIATNFNSENGTIDVQSGVLQFADGYGGSQILIDGSNLDVERGAVLDFSSRNTTLRNNVNATGRGTVRLTRGDVTPEGEIRLNFTDEGGVEWLGGDINAGGAIINQGNFEIRDSVTPKRLLGILSNEGTVLHRDGSLNLSGGTFNNLADGIYELQSGSLDNINGTFNNSGVFIKNTDSSVNIAAEFNNVGNGIVVVNGGELYFSATGYHTPRFEGTLRLAGGNLRARSGLGGRPALIDVAGGTLEGSGQIISDVNNSGVLTPGFDNPGEEIGVLSISGAYTQLATGSLNLDIGGLDAGEFDRLNISGDATFDGTLNLNFFDGYVPQFGDAFVLSRFGVANSDIEDLTINVTGFDNSTVDWNWKPDIKEGQLILTTAKDGLSGADLEVQSVVTNVATADLGDEIEITWTVQNVGDTPATPNWSDRIYFSASPDSLAGARELLLQEADGFTILQPGEEYIQTATVKLPLDQNTPPGEYYLWVETDALGDRPETTETNNQAATTALNLTLPPLPDVVVTEIITPAEGVAGEAIQIKWTLTNNGVGDAAGTWTDVVYLSSDNAIGQDTEIDTFEFTGTIPEGESIERIQTIQLPADLQDDQYIVVRTDANDELFEQASDDNNIAISEQAISVVQPALPNLQIASVNPPVQALSNQSTVVEWTVTNAGNAPASEWYDQVWLSLEPRNEFGADGLPIPTDIFLGQIQNASYLEPGQSYSSSLEVNLPEGLSGNYHFIVYSNIEELANGRHHRLGRLLESDRTDNIGFGPSTQIDLTPPPDLQVKEVSALAQAFSGETTSITWTVANEGIGTTFQHNDLGLFIQSTTPKSVFLESIDVWNPLDVSWQDKLYLSADQELDAEDTLLGTFTHDGPLASGESYTKTQDVTLPVGISGNFFVLVETDVLQPNPTIFGPRGEKDAVFEGEFEDNNQNYTVTPIQVNLTPPPDLGVEILSAPVDATASREIAITYRVTNDGSTTTPNATWQDTFYLSTTAELDINTAIKLGERTHIGRLEPEAEYENAVSFTLPDDLNGDYFIFVSTDSEKAVFEVEDALDGENADFSFNVASQSISITSQPADLVVSSASTLATAEAGKATRIEWTVANVGTGDTAVENWVDEVIVSDNNVLGDADDQVLASFSQSGLLGVGESYTRNELVTLPNALAGQKHLFVVTDADNNVYEVPQDNGNASVALPITLPEQSSSLANLEVTQVSSPAITRAGELITVSWTVQNAGGSTTNNTVWYDNVYLSSSPTFDRNAATLLGEVRRTNPLAVGQQYTAQQLFLMPFELEGDFYVVVETDSRNQVSESAETENIANTPQAINIVAYQVEDPSLPLPQPVDPDVVELPVELNVVEVNAPSEGNSGQPLEISWTVRNDGEATGNRTWYDVVYLSQDQVFDPANDFYVGAVEREGLGAGESYQVSQSFDIPKGLSGPLYTFVVTDSTNRLNDTNLDNNVAFDSRAVQVSPIPPADIDLAAGDITVQTTGVAGRSTTVEYTVANQGTETISGTWVDTLYLSTDNQWDIGDVSLGQVQVRESLNGGESYTRDFTAALPGVVPGNYHFLIRSDIRNTFTEIDEDNNLAASVEQIAIDVDALQLDIPVSGTLGDRQSAYYQVNVDAGEILRLNFDSDSTAATNTLLLRYGDMPTGSEFDAIATNPFGSDVELVYSNTKAGTYYIEAVGTQVPEGTTNYSLTADVLDFSLSDIGTERGSNRGQVTLTLEGAQFTPDTTAKLVADDGTERFASTLTWNDETEIWATFDLRGLSTGQYDVTILDDDAQASLADSFTVTNGPVGELEVKVISPEAVRPEQSANIQVIYTNIGETDINAPFLSIDGLQTVDPNDPPLLVFPEPIEFWGINPDGPAGILSPGASGRKSIRFKPIADSGTIEFTANKLEDDLPIDWDSFKDDLKPLGYSDAAWDIVYDNFLAEVGDSTRDLDALLAENSSYLAALGEPTDDINELLAFELQQASQYQTLNQQFRVGSLGQGQSFMGDVQVLEDEDGNVVIDYNGILRLFARQPSGSYQAQPGDTGILTPSGSGYQLRELDGTVTTFRGDGRIASVSDPNNNRITFVRDVTQNNRLVRLEFSTGDFITYTYNAFGRIATATNQANVQTSFGYDPTGQFLTSVTTPAGTTTYEYENGLMSKITDATGVSVDLKYDSRGRLISQSLTNGESQLTYTYDSAGGVTVTDANGIATELFLNGRGQVAQVNDPLRNTAVLQYDSTGNLTGLQGPEGANLDYGYDERGNLVSQINPLGGQIQFTYDRAFNGLASVTDENGNPIRYSYDDRGNLEAITYADGSSEQFIPDDQGNIEQYTNRRNIPIKYDYNPRGQITRIDFQNGDNIEYLYNNLGQLTVAIESRDGVNTRIDLTYDPDTNFLTRISYPKGRRLDYDYDEVGRRTRLADQDGNVVNYAYDTAGRMAELTDGNNNLIVRYQYDALSRLAREDKGNGTYTTYTYDDASRLVNLVHHAPDGSINSSFGYTYNDRGLQTGVTTLDGTWSYTYDALGQLTGAVFASTNPAIENQDITYEYDAAGNRRRTVVNGDTTTYAANNLNQYTSAGNTVYDYDADGNLVSKQDGDQEWSFGYDDLNRLVSVEEPDGTLTEYVYDALGNRVASIRNGQRTEYLVDPSGLGNVVAEYDNTGELIAAYSHGIGLESRVSSTNKSSYFDFDYIGSTTGLTGATGSYLNQYAYRPFGEEVSGEELFETEAITNSFEYVGQWGIMEEANGLDFMRARFYDSNFGKFISSDPIGINSGEINFYRYALNNPVSFSDPLGLWTVSVGGSYSGGVGVGVGIDIDLVWDQNTPWDNPRVQITLKLGGYAGASVGGGATFSYTNANSTQDLTGWGIEYGASGWLPLAGPLAPGPSAGASFVGALDLVNYKLSGGGISVLAGGGYGFPFEMHLFGSHTWDFGSFKDITGTTLKDHLPFPLGPNTFKPYVLVGSDDLAPIDSSTTVVSRPFDPNDIIGPSGFGDENWLTADTTLPYTIRFENLETATAAAQEVVITNPLDPDLDWRTFRLGSFGWSGLTFEVPENRSFYQDRIDLTEDYGFYVDVVARIDVIKGVATWTLTTIDPETGQKTNDALVGFLPPNIEDGIGEGFVTYTIQPDDDVETGAVIDAEATIVFDTEAPIDTPPIFNTLDAGTPTSTMSVLPTTSSTPEFLVSWSGNDDANGSGIAGYTVYVSTNGGAFTPWLENTTLTEATYLGDVGNTYEFYVTAIDNAGNQEPRPLTAQSTIQVVASSTNQSPDPETNDGSPITPVNDPPILEPPIPDQPAIAITPEPELTPELTPEPTPPASPAPPLSIINGTPGNDVLRGTPANDLIFGFNGRDRLFGSDGDDILVGGNGRDRLQGGNGDDILIGGNGRDRMRGGNGADIFFLQPGPGFARIIDFNLDEDKIGLPKDEIRLGSLKVSRFRNRHTLISSEGDVLGGLVNIDPRQLNRRHAIFIDLAEIT